MRYPYMTLPDRTEITHSEMEQDGRVRVYIETPDAEIGFRHAVCVLPGYEWQEVEGYTEKEMDFFRSFVQNNAHLILAFSKQGGILNAAVV